MTTPETFKKKTEETLAKIPNRDEWCDENKLVKEVFTIANWLLANDLDKMGYADLLRKGGRLLGIYTYLSNTTSRLKAERDVYEHQTKEDINEDIIKNRSVPDTTISEAEAKAKLKNAEKYKSTLLKEYEKNNYENLLKSIDNMLRFFQTAISLKKNEEFNSRDLADQN